MSHRKTDGRAAYGLVCVVAASMGCASQGQIDVSAGEANSSVASASTSIAVAPVGVEPAQSEIPAPIGPDDNRGPIERFLLVPSDPDVAVRWAIAMSERAAAACMEDRGHEYVPQSPSSVLAGVENPNLARLGPHGSKRQSPLLSRPDHRDAAWGRSPAHAIHCTPATEYASRTGSESQAGGSLAVGGRKGPRLACLPRCRTPAPESHPLDRPCVPGAAGDLMATTASQRSQLGSVARDHRSRDKESLPWRAKRSSARRSA
jgi:hypothetical protein